MPGHFIARNLRDFLARRSRHRFDFYLARIREHGHDSGVMRGVRKDGSERLADAFNNLLTVISSPLRCSSRITVLDAPTGAEAIRVLMPGMTGRELYEHLARRHPGLMVLYVSGYADDEVLRTV